MFSVKGLVESGSLTVLPSDYVCSTSPTDLVTQHKEEETIPIIDFSQLISSTPVERSKVVQDIGHACKEWGCFMVINHGMREKLSTEMLKASQSFFDISEEEKREYAGRDVFSPVRCGIGFNASMDKGLHWRDYLRAFVHPDFHIPNKPSGFREIAKEYCEAAQELAVELLKGISKSLGLDEDYMNKQMEVEVGTQILNVNLYPPCPKPELAMGLPPHADFGLLTLLVQNEIHGLDVLHKGKWISVNPPPNSFLVFAGIHLEILSNGIYKSSLHRAMVNNSSTRISAVIAYGPPLDMIVSPAKELVSENNHPAFRRSKYREYFELQQSQKIVPRAFLDHVRL